jgi:hypothetical protein
MFKMQYTTSLQYFYRPTAHIFEYLKVILLSSVMSINTAALRPVRGPQRFNGSFDVRNTIRT